MMIGFNWHCHKAFASETNPNLTEEEGDDNRK
jgi:hypothetical protein